MKWFKPKYVELDLDKIEPLPHQLDAMNQSLITLKSNIQHWGRASGKTMAKVLLAHNLLRELDDYVIVRKVK